MKIIDIFNKIANEEEAPKKIRYISTIYEYNGDTKNYYEEGKNSYYTNSLYYQLYSGKLLNEEVEIIEEHNVATQEHKIENIKVANKDLINAGIYGSKVNDMIAHSDSINILINEIQNDRIKLNEIIYKISEMEDK